MKRRTPIYKGAVRARFTSDCIGCPRQMDCVTCGGLGKDKVQYAKQIRGIRDPPNEAMKRGKELHEMLLSPYKEVDEKGIFPILEDIRKGKRVELSEVKICSRMFGLRGIIDKLVIQLNGKELFLEATELKTGYYKGYIFQLAAYSLILSDPRFEIIYEKKTVNGKNRITGLCPFADKPINKTIVAILHIITQDNIMRKEWMNKNMLTSWGNGMTMAVQKRLKIYRKLHKNTIVFPEDIDKNIKHKQRFWGKQKVMIKVKPRMYNQVV